VPPPAAAPYGYGKKKALVIGCNYVGTANALNGCINDANYLKYLLKHKFQFPENEILVLTDDSPDPYRVPTKANILNAIHWLVQDAAPGDSLWFSFSGHGGQVPDKDGDEEDGLDETILPSDFKVAGPIIDDELQSKLAARVPNGCKLTCIMDCCHSGTGMDLPYEYKSGRVVREARPKYINGDVVCFSGCLDSQTAADSKSLSKVVNSGVLTFTFVKSIEAYYPNLTYGSLLNWMDHYVKEKGFTQSIQMSSGKQLDLNAPFIV